MKKIGIIILTLAMLITSMISFGGCGGGEYEGNIVDKVFKDKPMVSRFERGKAFDPWIGSEYGEDEKRLKAPTIEKLKSDGMMFNNWCDFWFEFKTGTIKIVGIAFEVIAEEDCVINLEICNTGTKRYGSIKGVLVAGVPRLFDFTELDLSKNDLNIVVIANRPPEDFTWQEYEAVNGYTARWKIVNLKVYGEKI